MPIFEISTNVSREKIPADFLKEATKKMAAVLSKPPSVCVVQVRSDENMTWDSTRDPCAVINLSSIGFKLTTNEMTQELGPFVCKALGIAPDRYYIVFHHLTRENVGHRHMDVATLQKQGK